MRAKHQSFRWARIRQDRDLRFHSRQPDTSSHYETMDTGLVYCVVCLFTPQFSLVLSVPTLEGWPGWVNPSGWLSTKMARARSEPVNSRDVNKDKFQNPRPRNWPSLPRPRPRTWASCSKARPRTYAFQLSRPRPRTLFPQGLFRLNVSLFITLVYIDVRYTSSPLQYYDVRKLI